MPITNFTIPDTEQGSRFDAALARLLPEYSRSLLQNLIEKGEVTVDLAVRKSKFPLLGGEHVQINLPDPEQVLSPSSLPLEFIYQDEHLRVFNKPAGLVIHPNSLDASDSLVQRLLAQFPSIRLAVYDENSATSRLRPGIVHRLDKDTTGVVVTATTKESLLFLSEQFHTHQTTKSYLVLLSGDLKESQEVRTGMLRKSGKENVMGVTKLGEGREALSTFFPLQVMQLADGRSITLARCDIMTGRTHQIRVHAKYIGHAVLGDVLYGNKTSVAISQRLTVIRQLLHSHQLTIAHPHTGEMQQFTAPIPADMRQIVDNLAPKALEMLAL